MQRDVIATNDLQFPPFDVWATRWGLLACGDHAKRDFNCMTVSWGSMGVMWGKPFVMVVVRPTRYSFEFMERFGDFTLAVFPPQFKDALNVLRSRYGREMDKVGNSGLTPMASREVASPSWEEAELILECRKMYFGDLEPRHFMDEDIPQMYHNDYHRMYFGEVVLAAGTAAYRRS